MFYAGVYIVELSTTKVSKGKHRGKKQEKEVTESAAEPEGEPPAGNHNYHHA